MTQTVSNPLKIEYRNLENLLPYARNPRKNDQAVERMAASIREFGFRIPILVDSAGTIIDGHLRLKAAQNLGLESVPVIITDDLTEAQIKAFRLLANRSVAWAEWDAELLSLELQELKALDIDLELTGFDPDEIQSYLDFNSNQVEAVEVDAPLPPDEAITQPGDLWVIGKHRLLCGDAGKAEDVDRLLDVASIHLVNTDPPYNVKVEPRSNNAIAAGLSSFGNPQAVHHQKFDLSRCPEKARASHKKLRPKDRPLENDFLPDEEFALMLRSWFAQCARVLLPGRAFYIWGGYANCSNYPPALKENGLYFSQSIIWVKEHPVLTRKDFMGNHEWCFYGWREGAAHQFLGPNNAVDVWSVKKVNPNKMVHLTQKPIELAVRAIQYSSRPGENVLDLFGGSGSTLLGCEQAGRNAFLMELDPLYCDVIVNRWQDFTGLKAERI